MDRALQVLDFLYETGSPSGVYAIAKAVGAPLSTAYVIVDDMVEKNLLTPRCRRPWSGSATRLYHYGLAYARSLDFLGVATREMHDLGREVAETIQLCGRDGDYMQVLAMADGPGHFQVTSQGRHPGAAELDGLRTICWSAICPPTSGWSCSAAAPAHRRPAAPM